MGIFLMSINSVVISPRFDTSPKTKFAAGSVNRPLRGVPIMIGRKTGRVTSSAAILRFVAGTRGILQAQFCPNWPTKQRLWASQFARMAELADTPYLEFEIVDFKKPSIYKDKTRSSAGVAFAISE